MTSASDLLDLIRLRFPASEYALFTELRSATGHGRIRSADAVAFSLWPSRGLDLHGFEVKVERRDLARELKDPAKADEIASYCDYWWLVISDRSIIPTPALLPLPKAWGVLVPGADGKLVVHTEPRKLRAKKLDRRMFASIFRNAQTAMERRLNGYVRPELVEGRVRELADLETQPLRSKVEHQETELQRLREELEVRRQDDLLFGLAMWASKEERERVASIVRMLKSDQRGAFRAALARDIAKFDEIVSSMRRAWEGLEEPRGTFDPVGHVKKF